MTFQSDDYTLTGQWDRKVLFITCTVELLSCRAYEVYKNLLDLNFHDQIPTKSIMQLLRLAEEEFDINMALDLLSHSEKIKSIEYVDHFNLHMIIINVRIHGFLSITVQCNVEETWI
jgi:hypothetical protein